jgi:hypothetical protein
LYNFLVFIISKRGLSPFSVFSVRHREIEPERLAVEELVGARDLARIDLLPDTVLLDELLIERHRQRAARSIEA